MMVLYYKLVKKIKQRKKSNSNKNRKTLNNGDAAKFVEMELISSNGNREA